MRTKSLEDSSFSCSSIPSQEKILQTFFQLLFVAVIRDFSYLQKCVHSSTPVLVPSFEVQASFDFSSQMRVKPNATVFRLLKGALQKVESLNLPALRVLDPPHDDLNAFLKGFGMHLVKLFTSLNDTRPKSFSAEYVSHANSPILHRMSKSFFCEESTKHRRVETTSS